MRCLNCGKEDLAKNTEKCPGCGCYLSRLSGDLLPSGKLLNYNKYQIDYPLGRGGFGVTYKAIHTKLDKAVAIKEFYPSAGAVRNKSNDRLEIYPEFEARFNKGLRRFLKEAKILNNIEHPNIVRVRDFFEENNTAYIVMNFISGKTLSSLLQQQPNNCLSPEKVTEIISVLVNALDEIHAASIYHLDIKPDNILITDKGKLVLVDFGASKKGMSNDESTPGFSLSYAPPELISGEPIGAYSDLYSLGIMLYQMLTGKLPPNALWRIYQDNWQPLDLEEPWHNLVETAVKLKSKDRPANVISWWQTASNNSNENLKISQGLRELVMSRIPLQASSNLAKVDLGLRKVLNFSNKNLPCSQTFRNFYTNSFEKNKFLERFLVSSKETITNLENNSQSQVISARNREIFNKNTLGTNFFNYQITRRNQIKLLFLLLSGAGLAVISKIIFNSKEEVVKLENKKEVKKIEKPEVKSSPSEENSSENILNDPVNLQFKKFSFEVVTVNERAEEIDRSIKEAEYFEQDIENNITLKMIVIPSGIFKMGSSLQEKRRQSNESPQHQVEIKSFLMSKFPVTQAQWREIASLPKIDRDLDPDPSYFKGDNLPVEQISWYDAIEFCQRLSQKTGLTYRLPSEAEWEYAARANTKTPFNFGATISSNLANYNSNYIYARELTGKFLERTVAVESFFPNAFGLYNIHGNIFEWCADTWSDNYQNTPTDGSANQTGNSNLRVFRGGSWHSDALSCRSAHRNRDSPDLQYRTLGLRVACNLER